MTTASTTTSTATRTNGHGKLPPWATTVAKHGGPSGAILAVIVGLILPKLDSIEDKQQAQAIEMVKIEERLVASEDVRDIVSRTAPWLSERGEVLARINQNEEEIEEMKGKLDQIIVGVNDIRVRLGSQ